jgi:ABC-type spermidine/putrescine transport system permease subunit I
MTARSVDPTRGQERMDARTEALVEGVVPGRGGRAARTSWRPSFTQVMLGIPVLYMLVLFAYPVAGVLSRSFTEPTLGLGNFADALTNPVILKIMWITARLALEVALITVVLGFPIAYYMSIQTGRRARIIALLVIIPFWTSVLVRSFAWIVLLGDGGIVTNLLSPITGSTEGLLYTEAAVVIGMVHVMLPIAVLVIKASMDQIDPGLLKAARTLGAGPVTAYVRVYLPLAWPAVVSSFMLMFILGLGYYITPALMGGPEQTTLAMMIERNVNVTVNWGMAATLSTILMVASLVIYGLVGKFTKLRGVVGL